MKDRIVTFKMVEEALEFIGDNILKNQAVILIGGAALLEHGLDGKAATKDVDLLMTEKTFEDLEFDMRARGVWTFGNKEFERLHKGRLIPEVVGPYKLRRFLLQENKEISYDCTVDCLINDQLFQVYAEKAWTATVHGKLNVARLRYDTLKTIGLK